MELQRRGMRNENGAVLILNTAVIEKVRWGIAEYLELYEE